MCHSDRSPSGGYSDEFKVAAVRLVTEEGYSIAAAAKAVGVSRADAYFTPGFQAL